MKDHKDQVLIIFSYFLSQESCLDWESGTIFPSALGKDFKIASILAFSSFGGGGGGHTGSVPPHMPYLKSSPYAMNGLGLTVSPMDMHPTMGYPPGTSFYHGTAPFFYSPFSIPSYIEYFYSPPS